MTLDIVYSIILLYVFLFQNDQDYLTNEEFIESRDDDANPEEAQLMKKRKKSTREEESACGQKLQ